MSEFQTKLNSVPSGGFLTDRDKDKKPILDVRELGIDDFSMSRIVEKIMNGELFRKKEKEGEDHE